jgi:GNAT superfamily N-acetyltransferase
MIRPYATSDAERCCEIIAACLPQLTDMNETARDWVRAKNVPAAMNRELAGSIAVVYAEGNLVLGFGALADAEIKRVYIDPAHQHHGIGTALVTILEQEAVRRHLPSVHLTSRPDAVLFYLALGYSADDSESFVVDGAEFSVVHMHKPLAYTANLVT